jgi:hypothetical protein
MDRSSVSLVVSVLALFVAGIAAVLQWQGNQVEQKATSPAVAVVSDRMVADLELEPSCYQGTDEDGERYASWAARWRVADTKFELRNTGGAQAVVVGIEAMPFPDGHPWFVPRYEAIWVVPANDRVTATVSEIVALSSATRVDDLLAAVADLRDHERVVRWRLFLMDGAPVDFETRARLPWDETTDLPQVVDRLTEDIRVAARACGLL